MKNDLNNYDNSNNDNKNSEAACLAVNKFDELRKTTCYAAENENESAYQAEKTDLC